MLGLRDAINEQAQQPDADPQTSAWAAGVVSASLTHLETGLEDYFNSVEAVPPPPEPGSAQHHDDSLEEDADDPDEAEADCGTEDEDEPESEQSGDPDDTAPLPPAPAPHRNRSRGPRTFHAHPITSPVARAALTTVALVHLALVAFVTGSTAYSSDDFTGPTSWLLPPTIVLFHLLIGLLYGHRKMPLSLMAVVLPPAIIVMTVLCAVSFSNMHGVHLNPVALGAAWASIFSPGLLALTYAVRAWLGQIQYVDTK
ncbi:MAG TPA: hypothetical protein VN520_21065 [Streptomyces sp.]|uniref:hypothetical protein n=1 Tax=Streptomyces sp. TaxID=1931 RepID=UPI002D1C00EF|nr:hypothetical protein [Streptomyces sp.]HWU08839.1 hypothetical protein [Streptomyces sp.]